MEANQTKTKNTFLSQKKEQINSIWNKLNIISWNKFYIFWGYLWLSYFLMLNYIMPLLKQVFLIATWDTIFIFYTIIFFMAFIFTIINNFLLKTLLYLFK